MPMFSAGLDLKLPLTSMVTDIDVRDELNGIYAAMQILQQETVNNTRTIITYSEAVLPGQLVNIYNNAGVLSGRLASAADATRPANGFALLAVAAGKVGEIKLAGLCQVLAGLTVAGLYYLSDSVPGGITNVRPVGAGKIVQPIGTAYSASVIQFMPNNNWTQL